MTAPATVHPINQTIEAGDMTMFVNYAHHTEDATEVHVQVVNFGAEPAAAILSVGDDGIDPQSEQAMVPAKSTQHRVLRVRKDRDRAKTVEFRFQHMRNMVLIDE